MPGLVKWGDVMSQLIYAYISIHSDGVSENNFCVFYVSGW